MLKTQCDSRLWGFFATLCMAAGTLHLFLFVLMPVGGVVGDVGTQARALSLAAASVLPAAAVGCFFLGVWLIIIAHIRAGGVGGSGTFGAADGQIQGRPAVTVRFLTKVARGAAAAIFLVMSMSLYGGATS